MFFGALGCGEGAAPSAIQTEAVMTKKPSNGSGNVAVTVGPGAPNPTSTRRSPALDPMAPQLAPFRKAFDTPVDLVLADTPLGNGVLAIAVRDHAGMQPTILLSPENLSPAVEQSARSMLAVAMATAAAPEGETLTLYTDWSVGSSVRPEGPRKRLVVSNPPMSAGATARFQAAVTAAKTTQRRQVAGRDGVLLRQYP